MGSMLNPTPTVATPHKASGAKKKLWRILYAEDLEELRDMVKFTLVHEGHAVECADDGMAALRKISRDMDAFDLVITDHLMPNMCGLELVTRLRALSFPGKILVFTSGLSNEAEEAYSQLKVDGILYKPVTSHGLNEALAKL
jgi:CheY-like chemotaxis protein